MHHSPRKLVLTLVKWLLSLGMLAYALREIDMAEITRMLEAESPLIPIAAVLLIVLQVVFATWRWQHLLFLLGGKKQRTSYLELFDLNYVSIFFNSCLPGTIGGDVVRAAMLKSPERPMTLCIHSVIIDRLLAVVAVFFMVTASLPLLAEWLPALPAWPLFAGSILLVVVGLALLKILPGLFAKLPSTSLVRHSAQLLESFRRTVFALRDFIILLMQAVLAHAAFCASAWVLAKGIGVDLSFVDTLVLVPPVLLLMMLPVSVGGWGVREVSMVGFLALAGVGKEAALTISVQLGILTIIASLPGALCYLRRRGAEKNASPQS